MQHGDSSTALNTPAAGQLSSFHEWFDEAYEAPPSNPDNSYETEWNDDDDETEEIYHTSFEKFPHLPLELQRIVLSHAVKEVVGQSSRSKRILVGEPIDYSAYPIIRPGNQSMSDLRAVNSFFKQEVEQLLFRDNIVVFDMVSENSVFEQKGIGAHSWLANQSADILAEVREIYVLGLPYMPDTSVRKAGQALTSQEVIETHEARLFFRFCDALQERLPGLQRMIVKFDIIFPAGRIVFEAEEVQQLKMAITERVCVPGRLRQFQIIMQTPEEADADIVARNAASADDLRRVFGMIVDGTRIPSHLQLEW